MPPGWLNLPVRSLYHHTHHTDNVWCILEGGRVKLSPPQSRQWASPEATPIGGVGARWGALHQHKIRRPWLRSESIETFLRTCSTIIHGSHADNLIRQHALSGREQRAHCCCTAVISSGQQQERVPSSQQPWSQGKRWRDALPNGLGCWRYGGLRVAQLSSTRRAACRALRASLPRCAP